MASMTMPDFVMAVARNDIDAARQRLSEMPEYGWAYLSWLLRRDPAMAEVANTPEARRIIEAVSSRRQRQLERLQESAPAGLLEN